MAAASSEDTLALVIFTTPTPFMIIGFLLPQLSSRALGFAGVGGESTATPFHQDSAQYFRRIKNHLFPIGHHRVDQGGPEFEIPHIYNEAVKNNGGDLLHHIYGFRYGGRFSPDSRDLLLDRFLHCLGAHHFGISFGL